NQYCSGGACFNNTSCKATHESCNGTEDCAAGFYCLDSHGYACDGVTGCTCEYGVCGLLLDTCVTDLDCCDGRICTNGFCGSVSSQVCRDATRDCNQNSDCCSNSCHVTQGACAGLC